MPAQYYIKLTVFFREEKDGRWTANCKELGTATFGSSFEDAQDKIQEAICLHLNTLEDVGERERFFEENNIELYKRPESSVRIRVPTEKNVFVHPQYYPVQYAEVC